MRDQIRVVGWSVTFFLDRLRTRYPARTITRNTFNNWCRPGASFPNEPALIAAIVTVFVADAPASLRWTPGGAVAFARAAGQSLGAIVSLAPLFPDSPSFDLAVSAITATGDGEQARLVAADALALLPLQEIPERAALPNASWGVPPVSITPFVGRIADLQTLAVELRRTPYARLVVTGLPGIGKTTLALELAWRYGQYLRGGVFFLHAETEEALQRDLLALGEALELGVRYNALQERGRLAEVQNALTRRPHCLLIVDNVDAIDGAALSNLLPAPTGACRVLLTSRRQDWPPGWKRFPLEPLHEREGIEMLLRLIGDEVASSIEIRHAARDLVSSLGHHPLALTLFGTFLSSRKLQGPGLLRAMHALLRERGSTDVSATMDGEALAQLEALVDGYLSHLDPAHPIQRPARDLLAIAALLPSGQPIDPLLLQGIATQSAGADGLPEPMAHAADALQLLLAQSLLTWRGGALLLHPLVRGRVRARFELRAAAARAAEHLWARLADEGGEQVDVIRSYEPALRAVATDAAELGVTRDAELSAVLGWYLTRASSHDDALRWCQRALTLALERYGEVHVITAEAWCRLGIAHLFRSEFEAARPAYQRMLELQAVVYPEDHPERLLGLLNTAQMLVIAGDFSVSQSYARQALRGFSALLRCNPETRDARATIRMARAMRVLSQNAAELGRPLRAARWMDAARRCSSNQWIVVQATHDLGHIMLTLGRYVEALQLLKQAYEARREQHRSREDQDGRIWHQDIAESLLGLGAYALATGENMRAEGLLREAMLIQQTVLGPEALEYGEVVEQVSESALQRGRVDEAHQLLDVAEACFNRLFESFG